MNANKWVADIIIVSHRNRWCNTQRPILTSKLDLPSPAQWGPHGWGHVRPQPGCALISDACSCLWGSCVLWGGGAGGAQRLVSHGVNSELWRQPQVRQDESLFPSPTRHDLIEAESPAFDLGHNPPTPKVVTLKKNWLHSQLIWRYNFIWRRYKATTTVLHLLKYCI